MNMFTIDDQLIFLIDRLNSAVNVCYEAPDIEDQGYPYATGYSRSAMSDVADSLSAIVAQMREEKDGPEGGTHRLHRGTGMPYNKNIDKGTTPQCN